MIFCLCSGDIYIFLCITLSSLLFSSLFVIELFWGEIVEALAILSVILFPIKSPVASTVFWIAHF